MKTAKSSASLSNLKVFFFLRDRRRNVINSLILFLTFFGVSQARADVPVSDTFVVSTFAGRPARSGYLDGDKENARFGLIGGIAADGAGNVYVLDQNTLRKVEPNGTLRTIIGKPHVMGTNDGPATVATLGPVWGYGTFQAHQGIAVDSQGNICVADFWFRTIRKISPDGVVTTMAGQPSVIGYQDGKGNEALFGEPVGLCFDGQDNLYVTDRGYGELPNRIRKISREGIVSTIQTKTADGAPFSFYLPSAIAATGDGSLYVADPSVSTNLWKIAPDGTVSPAAKIDTTGTNHLRAPTGLTLTPDGNLIVSTERDFLQKIAPDGTTTYLAGGSEIPGSSDGASDEARFLGNRGVAADSLGNIYIADTGNNCIRKVAPNGTVSTLAGFSGGREDGAGSEARFLKPEGLTMDANGNLVVADTLNHTIRKISPDGLVTTLAGTPGEIGNFPNPTGVAINANGEVLVMDTRTRLSGIRKVLVDHTIGTNDVRGFFTLYRHIAITPDGTIYMSSGTGGGNPSINLLRIAGEDVTAEARRSGYKDGPLETAGFYYPSGMASDSSNNLYVADFGNAVIRKITPEGIVSTVAGQPQTKGTRDGQAAEAQFLAPLQLALGPSGDLYILDNGDTLRKLSTNGMVTTITLIGSIGLPHFSSDGTSAFGVGTDDANRGGIAVDKQGRIFLASTTDNTIKIAVPASASVSLEYSRNAAGILSLSWPTLGSNLVLEATSDLSAPGSWSKVKTESGTQQFETKAEPRKFYRLQPR